MLTTGNDILAVAHEYRFAVPAFNISSYSMLRAVVDVCEEKRSPHIIAIHPDELSHIRPEMLASMILIARKSTVPTAIHLDHGATYGQVLLAIQSGFTSVMIDKSFAPFEENIAETSRVVRAAHAVGVSVEAELGTIGVSDKYGETGSEEILYTDPDDAEQFIEATGADSLAIAIGTRHGLYPSEVKPALRLDLLAQIKERLGIPLVLHGGSNNSDKEIAGAVRGGINKINISSDIKAAYFLRMREVLEDIHLPPPPIIAHPPAEAARPCAAPQIALSEPAGKAAPI